MEDADNPDVRCEYIRALELTWLRESDNKDALKAMCFHNVRNAFDKVCFGANEYGIHRATMTGSVARHSKRLVHVRFVGTVQTAFQKTYGISGFLF
jgi:hypothetical protein